jgi:hypothetical protein
LFVLRLLFAEHYRELLAGNAASLLFDAGKHLIKRQSPIPPEVFTVVGLAEDF